MITQAIIPAAGYGTRFLPATKEMPKEMLPIVDKPVIQYIVEDAVVGGVTDIYIVTGKHKHAIEDHFDVNPALEKFLTEHYKNDRLAEIKKISNLANFVYIRQNGGYGNATPVKCCRNIVNNTPFFVLWGDELFYSDTHSRIQQLNEVYDRYQLPVLTGVRIDNPEKISHYGVSILGEQVDDATYKLNGIHEKPKIGEAPSNIAIIGAYLLPPKIFEVIDLLAPGKDGEYWLVDAINDLIKTTDVLVHVIKGRHYDIGNKTGFIEANIDFGVRDKDVNGKLIEYMKNLIAQL